MLYSADPKLGGVIEAVRLQQAPLLACGVEVEIVSCDSPDSPWLNGQLPVQALGPSKYSYGYTPHLLPWLRANAHRFDAVIAEGIWQYHSFAVWRALRGAATPYYIFPHGMLDPWFKQAYPLKHFKKWLYWPWAEYRALRDARRVIFTCDEERRLAKKSFWLYKVNAAVGALGVATPPENGEGLAAGFLNQYPDLQSKRIVLYLGRIHEKKGCDLLIEAFAKVAVRDANLHLVMAGPDPTGWLPKLQAHAEELGIPHRITWSGMLQGDMKWGAFYAAEVFCLPSHQENFGIVVAEALACGKPVLISNKVNIWREIEAAGAGFVADDTQAGTEELLNCWLALNTEDFAVMRAKTLQCFQEHFHVKRAARRLVEIIRECK
ncbi:glycosyltransferase [Ferrigenium sp. UT5]|uniref:glycosyltransferase n=1 Tax=Ferrigenium sp. UT5 TaxID=3242105 RepID=UPI0038B357D3